MNHLIRSILAVCILVGAPAAVAAQARADEALQPGRRMIAVSLPWGGGGAAGIWLQRSLTSALGIEASANIEASDPEPADAAETRLVHLVLSPTLKTFMTRDHESIAPFTRVGVSAGYVRQEVDFTDRPDRLEEGWLAGVHAGVGAEWFPLERISIGGWIGLAAAYRTIDGHAWSVSTTAPRLTGQIYF